MATLARLNFNAATFRGCTDRRITKQFRRNELFQMDCKLESRRPKIFGRWSNCEENLAG